MAVQSGRYRLGFVCVAILDLIHTCALVAASIVWVIYAFDRLNWSDPPQLENAAQDHFFKYFYLPMMALITGMVYIIFISFQILDPIVLLLMAREDSGNSEDLVRTRRYELLYCVAQGLTVVVVVICALMNLVNEFWGIEILISWEWICLWCLLRGIIFCFGKICCKNLVEMVKGNVRDPHGENRHGEISL